jgi:hypothetical protein
MDQPDGPVTRAEFQQGMSDMEVRLGERMQLMQTEIGERMGLMQTDIGERMGLMQTEIEDRMTERTRDMQTEIIRVFMEFQQRNEARDDMHEKTGAVLSERVASVERRLLQIEKKLLLEPPAA